MTKEQEIRYNRHIILDKFGIEGQERLLSARILIVGAGGLGSPAALYLAAAGVGTIGIADADEVSISNLQRQVIHFTADQGRPKTQSAAEKMCLINPDIHVISYPYNITEQNARDIISQYDFVLSCTDSFQSKYLINDVCLDLRKPFCMAGIVGYCGQMMTWVPGAKNYRDIFAEVPQGDEVETCSRVGVLGSAVGTMGTLQATEAIKYIVGVGQLLTNALLTFDALSLQFMKLEL